MFLWRHQTPIYPFFIYSKMPHFMNMSKWNVQKSQLSLLLSHLFPTFFIPFPRSSLSLVHPLPSIIPSPPTLPHKQTLLLPYLSASSQRSTSVRAFRVRFCLFYKLVFANLLNSCNNIPPLPQTLLGGVEIWPPGPLGSPKALLLSASNRTVSKPPSFSNQLCQLFQNFPVPVFAMRVGGGGSGRECTVVKMF